MTQPTDVATGLDEAKSHSITDLLSISGLSASQVGRLLGVGSRQIHNWRAGTVVPPREEQRAAEILTIVRTLPGATAVERRAALLYSARGPSIFHRLLAQSPKLQRIQGSALSVADRIALILD